MPTVGRRLRAAGARRPRRSTLGHIAAPALAVAALSGCGQSPLVATAPPAAPPPAKEDPPATVEQRTPLQIAGEDPGPEPAIADDRCDLASRIAALAPGCERLRGVSASATGAAGAAAAAFDGDACSIWNAGGFPPQSATLDLGAPMTVSAVVLVPEMSPATATVRHTLEASDDGKRFAPIGQMRVVMRSGDLVELPIPGGVTTRFLRIATSESPSWVAWRDVVVLRCGAARR